VRRTDGRLGARRSHRRRAADARPSPGATAIFCVPIVWLLAAGTWSWHELGRGLEVAWGFVHPPSPAPGVFIYNTPTAAIVRDSSLLIWLPLAGAALWLIARRLRTTRRLGAGAFVALTIAVLVIDLFRANMGFNPAIRTSTATPPVTGAIRYLQSQRPNRFIGVSTNLISQPLPADLAMRFGLYDARAYDYPVEKRVDALWRRNVAHGSLLNFTQPEQFASATPAAVRALDLLSVKDLLVGPDQTLHGPGLRVAYRGTDGVVYSNSRALPRVFVVSHQETIGAASAELDAVTAPGFDGRGTAVTSVSIPGLPQSSGASAPAGSSAHFQHYGAERVVIDAAATAPSVLVLTDTFYPGWTATVDGRSVPIQEVDYLLRGVRIGPGRHTIVFEYKPESFEIGWIVSVISLAVVLGLAASAEVARRRRRAGRRPADGPPASAVTV
jgi:hypothetical protein